MTLNRVREAPNQKIAQVCFFVSLLLWSCYPMRTTRQTVILLAVIIGFQKKSNFWRPRTSTAKFKKLIATTLLSLQLTAPILGLSSYFINSSSYSEAFQSCLQIEPKNTDLAFNYNDKKMISAARRHFFATSQRLALFSKTHKRLLNEHLPITAAGIAVTGIGVRHLFQDEKVIGGAEVVLGGYLILRSQLSEELQVNKNLLMGSSFVLLLLENSRSFNLEKNKFYEALEHLQMELSSNENKLRYLNMALKDQEVQSAEDNQHFVFKLAQQKSLLVENNKKEIKQVTTECYKKINEHLVNVEALRKNITNFSDKVQNTRRSP